MTARWLENDIREYGATLDSSDNGRFIKMMQDDFMKDGYGGEILIPRGNFRFGGATISLLGGVTLVGQGRGASFLTTGDDMPAVVVEKSTGFAGMRQLTLDGYAGSDAKYNLVTISDNQPAFIEHARLHGGNFALENNGIDGYFEDIYTNGAGRNGGGIMSHGANWYNRMKLDQLPQRVGFSFYQGKPIAECGGIAENHFEMSDYSGNHDHSIYINDEQTNSAVTVISGGVHANKILIDSARWTCLDIAEIGNEVLLNDTHGGHLTLVNGYAFSTMRVGGSKRAKVRNMINMDDAG